MVIHNSECRGVRQSVTHPLSIFISCLSCVFWSCWVYVGMLETLRCLPPVKAKMAQREPAAPTTNSIQLSVPGKPHRSDIVTWLRIHLELFRYLRQEDLAQKKA